MDSVTYSRPGMFIQELRQRVNAHLEEAGLPRHGGMRIILKSLLIFALFVVSYIALVFFAETWWQVVLAAFLLAQSIVLIGFCIMHDASHGAFSASSRLNLAMRYTLDLVGGSQALWKVKHVSMHHGYPNILGLDDDLDTGGKLRMHPGQPWKPWHRFQVWYAFPIYSLLVIHWIISDFTEFFRAEIGGHRIQKPRLREVALFLGFKLHYVAIALVVPFLFNPWLWTAVTYLSIMLLLGFTFSLVFQLAHITAGVDAPAPTAADPVTGDWAEHQLHTTADFAPRNPVLNWYMGGLNAQVVHHLFPRISHVRYPRLQPIIAKTCEEMGVPYHCHRSLVDAIRAHLRQLRDLSRNPGQGEQQPTPSVA